MSVTVPSGYKQTKVGVIPEDWGTYRIDNVLQRIRKKVEVEKEVMYQQIGIRSHAKGIFHKELVSGEALGNKSVFWIEEDCFIVNIVFAWEQAVAKTTEAEKGMIASHRFPMYKAKDNKVNIDYILYFFKSKRGKYLLGLASPGGAGRNKTLGQKEFSELKLPLPSLEEQQKIAQILTTWDDAISKQEEFIKAKETLKKGLMQKLLSGEVRFSGFDGEWEEVSLGDIGTFKSGFGFPENQQGKTNQKYPFYKVSDMNLTGNEVYMKSENHSISEDVLKQLKGKTIPKNSIIFAKVGAALLLDRRRITTKESCLDNNMMAFIPNKELIDTNFIYSKFLMIRFAKLANVGALPSIGAGDLKTYKISIPELEEQQKIAQILTTADKEIELLKKELETLKEQKRGLMQRLLSGVVRVRV